jgi:hypothetical protein
MMAAFLINSLSCSHTLLKITIKSGFLQSTISIKKKDLVLRNMVCEKNKPINKAINPEARVKPIIATHPHIPNNKLEIKEITITLALQAINGAIKIEITRSLVELALRANIIAGTLQPNPVRMFTTLRPLIPNFSNIWSSNTDTRDKIPTWLIMFTKINKITMTGINDSTAKKPFRTPSINNPPNH